MLSAVPEAFVFDLFGTVFDWRTSVSTRLFEVLSAKLQSLADGNLAGRGVVNDASQSGADETIKSLADSPDKLKAFCSTFSQEWRDSYGNFTSENANDTSEGSSEGEKKKQNIFHENDTYTTIDDHHHSSVRHLLKKHNLLHLFSRKETFEISQVWHVLKPWDDSRPGVQALRKLGVVSSLSNGNVRLLVDLQKNSDVQLDLVLSGQFWKSFKPDEKVYVGACEVLGVGTREGWRRYVEEEEEAGRKVDLSTEKSWRREQRGRVAMVAAHISDLRAAKSHGLSVIYIERTGEDDGKTEAAEYHRKGEDWIDLWIKDGSGGIVEAANQLKSLQGRQ